MAVGQRVGYADLLKTLSMLAVITLHLSCNWISFREFHSTAWLIAVGFDGLCRFSVPLFIMVSGMFLLNPEKELPLQTLFRKYILRMLLILLFWGAFYCVMVEWYQNGVTWTGFVTGMKLLCEGKTHFHLWYLYMLLGLYLITPLLRALIRGATRTELHWFFLLSGIASLLLPTILAVAPNVGISTWLQALHLESVGGYAVYFLGGYYLNTYELNRKTRGIIYGLGLAGVAVTIMGTLFFSVHAGTFSGGFFSYLTPNIAATSVAFFVFFRTLLEKGTFFWTTISQNLGKYSLGVYLLHPFFLFQLNQYHLLLLDRNPLWAVPVLTIIVFALSLGATWLLSKIPVIRRLV